MNTAGVAGLGEVVTESLFYEFNRIGVRLASNGFDRLSAKNKPAYAQNLKARQDWRSRFKYYNRCYLL